MILIKLSLPYYFIMRNLTIYHNWADQNLEQNSQIDGSQQMGLFTFYRQQADTNFVSDRFNEKVVQTQKSPKIKTKFKFHKPDQTQNQTLFSNTQSRKKSTNCELFLKNVANKFYKPQFVSKKESDTKLYDNWNKSMQNPQHNKLHDSVQLKSYNLVLQSTDGFVSRPLTNIQQIVQINNDKIVIHKDSTRYQKLKVHKKRQNAIKIVQETQKINDNHYQAAKNSRKSYKKALQNEYDTQQKSFGINTLQKTFLQKVRFNERSVEKGEKQQISSKKMKERREQNKKCLFNLIKSAYLPQREDKQTTNILSSTLKSNFIIKRLRTEYNDSPISIRAVKRQMKTVPHRRNISCLQNQQQKHSNGAQCIDLKPTINQRFRFLVRNQRFTGNHHHRQRKTLIKYLKI